MDKVTPVWKQVEDVLKSRLADTGLHLLCQCDHEAKRIRLTMEAVLLDDDYVRQLVRAIEEDIRRQTGEEYVSILNGKMSMAG